MFKHKTILVAGAGGLLGSNLVLALIEQGASVIAADINRQVMTSRLEALAGFNAAGRLTIIELDLNDSGAVKLFFQSVKGLDGAVNCAYPRNKHYGAKLFDVELEHFNENVSLHLGATFLFMQQCAAYFEREKHPFSLVNISSVYGVIAPRFEVYENTAMTMPVEYAAIKSGVIQLSKYLTAYVSNSLFRSNCVSPGGIFDNQPQAFLDKYKAHCMGKGMLDIGDVTGTVLFLLSENAKYVNGQNIVVDDGFSL
ncbi:oxidoreductase [Pseudomonas trivialis]|uniref:Flagellin modification protein A n=1 Tax=Pseudomonas trivialis TaxID=200450 RepID=A0A0H5A430_9PSED|nr:oxidoreductase [Pseudomonas trivialis]AKS05646.1 flagellin modification protein A [Pseudomonas trivialis]